MRNRTDSLLIKVCFSLSQRIFFSFIQPHRRRNLNWWIMGDLFFSILFARRRVQSRWRQWMGGLIHIFSRLMLTHFMSLIHDYRRRKRAMRTWIIHHHEHLWFNSIFFGVEIFFTFAVSIRQHHIFVCDCARLTASSLYGRKAASEIYDEKALIWRRGIFCGFHTEAGPVTIAIDWSLHCGVDREQNKFKFVFNFSDADATITAA